MRQLDTTCSSCSKVCLVNLCATDFLWRSNMSMLSDQSFAWVIWADNSRPLRHKTSGPWTTCCNARTTARNWAWRHIAALLACTPGFSFSKTFKISFFLGEILCLKWFRFEFLLEVDELDLDHYRRLAHKHQAAFCDRNFNRRSTTFQCFVEMKWNEWVVKCRRTSQKPRFGQNQKGTVTSRMINTRKPLCLRLSLE